MLVIVLYNQIPQFVIQYLKFAPNSQSISDKIKIQIKKIVSFD
jgi:hypothetical protein